MRLRIAALFPLVALTAASAGAAQTFPYTAYVTADDVYVRSGPGKTYYPTSKLKAGDAVEVYRHDPGGWYAIRPVEGSFAWVSGRYVALDEDGLGTTTADRVAARVGSRFSDIRDVIQVRLHQGETVQILGKKEFGGDRGSGTWYKIAPPSGEFRWVYGKFVDPEFRHSGVRRLPAAQPSDGLRTAEPSEGASNRDQTAPETAPRQTNRFVEPAHDPSGTTTLRRLSPREFQAELEEIDLELSIMLAEEPTVWKLDELVVRAEALLTETETAVERGRIRRLADRIAESEDIRRRFCAVGGTQTAAERPDVSVEKATGSEQRRRAPEENTGAPSAPSLSQGLADAQPAEPGQAARQEPSAAEPDGRFDGVGRLARVVPPKLGAPRFALVDERGKVDWFVTPATGVNMNYYVGRRIGVNGIRGYLPNKRTRHVTARHITPLEETQLR